MVIAIKMSLLFILFELGVGVYLYLAKGNIEFFGCIIGISILTILVAVVVYKRLKKEEKKNF